MKTTVDKGVLTSYELMLAILFRWRVWSCGHNIVCLWRSHGSGHGSDHHQQGCVADKVKADEANKADVAD